LAKPGVGRVLRYRSVTPPAGGSPSWAPDPDEYAIGFPADMRNGNGGVAIGYGYTPTGQIDHGACSAFLWGTGEQLRNAMDPAVIARLAASGPPIVNGLQGNAIALVRPANVPPLQTYFVDYDDNYNQDTARGHLGDVAIWRICGQALAPAPVVVPFGLIGGGGGACLPGAFRLRDGECCDRRDVRDGRCGCPPDTIRLPDGQCCDRQNVRDGRCGCPPGEIKLPNGMCCDRQNVRDGRCLPPSTCPPGQVPLRNGQCCDPANVRDGRCLPPPPNTCPRGQIKLPNGQCCDRANVKDGQCLPPAINTCKPGTVLLNGQCCPRADVQRDGSCRRLILVPVKPLKRKVDEPREPREPTRHPTFHTHIPTGVTIQGKPGITRTPSFPSRGGSTTTVPGKGRGSLILR
jgi:hypothetical protein